MIIDLSKEDLINLVRYVPISKELLNKYTEMGWGDWDYNSPFCFHDCVLEDLSEQQLWDLYTECYESYKQEFSQSLKDFYDRLNKS